MEFKILRIDAESKKIGLSARAVGKDEPIVDTKVYSSQAGSGMASLGELADFGLGKSEPEPQPEPEAVREPDALLEPVSEPNTAPEPVNEPGPAAAAATKPNTAPEESDNSEAKADAE